MQHKQCRCKNHLMSVMPGICVISHFFNHQGLGAVWTLLWMVWHCWTRLVCSQLISLCTMTTLRMWNSSLRVLPTFLLQEQLLSKFAICLYVWTGFLVVFCSWLMYTFTCTTVLKFQEWANACHCKESHRDLSHVSLISPLIDEMFIYEIVLDIPE